MRPYQLVASYYFEEFPLFMAAYDLGALQFVFASGIQSNLRMQFSGLSLTQRNPHSQLAITSNKYV